MFAGSLTVPLKGCGERYGQSVSTTSISRGTVNEPANISLVVDEIAKLRGMSKKHLLDVLYQNSCKLFNLWKSI